MNDISVKQNDPTLLKYQFGARYCYEKTDLLNVFIILLLISMVIFDGLFLYYDLNQIILIVITLILMFAQYKVNKYIEKLIKCAVYCKSRFDYALFKMELTNYDKNEIRDHEDFLYKIINNNKKYYKIQIAKSGIDTPSGVRDWYFDVDPSLSIDDATKVCMDQNIYFSKKISKKSLFSLTLTLVITLTVGTFILLNYTNIFIAVFLQLISVIGQEVHLIYNEFNFIINLSKIKSILDFNENFNRNDLIRIQSYTDEYRSINRITSKTFHSKHSASLHEMFNISNYAE